MKHGVSSKDQVFTSRVWRALYYKSAKCTTILDSTQKDFNNLFLKKPNVQFFKRHLRKVFKRNSETNTVYWFPGRPQGCQIRCLSLRYKASLI